MSNEERDYTIIRDKDVRTKICELMSDMLENPDEHGIYTTSKFMALLEDYVLEFKAALDEKNAEYAEKDNLVYALGLE